MTYREWRDKYHGGPYARSASTHKKVLAEMSLAERIAWKMLADITDRRGWRQEWERFDDEIKDEVFTAHVEIIRRELVTK